MNHEDPEPEAAPVSAQVDTLDGTPIIVERATWWPGPNASDWVEAHASPGVVSTGSLWALAEGEVGGASGWDTYVLLANPSAKAGRANVTLHYEDGGTASAIVPLPAHSRRTIDVRHAFPAAAGRRCATQIDALPDANAVVAPGIVVERSMYAADLPKAFLSAFPRGTPYWPAGTNSVATRLR